MTSEPRKTRLAIVATHPIQYYAPWFRVLAARPELELRVFYLWNPGHQGQEDAGFEQSVEWDIPLLSGYSFDFVPGVARRPGTSRLMGLRNPQLYSRIASWRPDAALLMAYNYAAIYRFLLTWRLKGRPFKLLFRGDSHRLDSRKATPKELLRRRLITAIFRQMDALLYVGQANKEYLRMHGVPDQKLFFSPHAVDIERFRASEHRAREESAAWRRDLGIPEDHTVLLFAGKFLRRKQSVALAEVFLEAKMPRCTLLYVGSGRREQEIRAIAEGHPEIVFAPFQNQTQMPRVYAAADLLVLPSLSETWGLVVNEAMCLGLPIVVSDLVGCARDLVRPGRNGLIFPARDRAAFRAALADASSDRQRLKRWGEESRKIVSEYSYENASVGLLQALASLNLPSAA